MKKEFRVKKSSHIEMILKNRQSKGNSFFVVYKKINHENNHFKVAISVSKKYGNAVKRNKIKRQVREIIFKMDILPNFDIFIVIKNKANTLGFDEIKNSIEKLAKKHDIMR